MKTIEEFVIEGRARSASCGKACRYNNTTCTHYNMNKTSSICYLLKSYGLIESKNAKDSACGFIHNRMPYKKEIVIDGKVSITTPEADLKYTKTQRQDESSFNSTSTNSTINATMMTENKTVQ